MSTTDLKALSDAATQEADDIAYYLGTSSNHRPAQEAYYAALDKAFRSGDLVQRAPEREVVAYLVEHKGLKERDLQFWPLIDADKDAGWTETPLYRDPAPVVDVEAVAVENARLQEAVQTLRNGYADAAAGMSYVLQFHGRLSGVGFDRVADHYMQWVTIPEREGLLAGSHHIARAALTAMGNTDGNPQD